MRQKKIMKQAGVFALYAVMALSMCSAVFAGTSGAYNSDNTDYVKNGTGNRTVSRQDNAAYTTWLQNDGTRALVGKDSGVVTLGKILNVSQAGKFPNVENFVYRVTPVSAWDNANADTGKSGASMTKADMPKPTSGSGNSNHYEVTKGSGDDWYSLVTIGNFKNEEDNTSTVTNSDAASNTAGVDDKYRRTRTTDLKFTFQKAGCYMYKVEEVGSIKNGNAITDDEVDLRKDVAGVDYDNNTYYMVFYVANMQAKSADGADEYGHGTKKGDTVGAEKDDIITGGAKAPAGGVYVHTITSWTNSPSTDHTAANLQDSQALDGAKDLMNAMDNGGDPAKPNTGRVDGNSNGISGGTPESNGNTGVSENGGPSTVTHDNLGKVGSSTPGENPPNPGNPPSATDNYIISGPNTLEAYRMWNALDSHDVVLKKNVTGNLGDRTKQFEFTVVLTGLESSQVYTTNVEAGKTDVTASDSNPANTKDQTTSNVILEKGKDGCTLAQDGKSFTSSETGTASFLVKLRDGEILVLNALPRSASYQVTEAASDHVPQYTIVSTNKAESGNKAIIQKAADKTTNASNKSLATAREYVDRYDGTVTVLFENNRDLATVTGIAGLDYMLYAAFALVLILATAGIIRRRKLYAEEEI